MCVRFLISLFLCLIFSFGFVCYFSVDHFRCYMSRRMNNDVLIVCKTLPGNVITCDYRECNGYDSDYDNDSDD